MPIPKSPWRRSAVTKAPKAISKTEKKQIEKKALESVREVLYEYREGKRMLNQEAENDDMRQKKTNLSEDSRKRHHGFRGFVLSVVFFLGGAAAIVYYLGKNEGLWQNFDEYVHYFEQGKFVEVFAENRKPIRSIRTSANRVEAKVPPRVAAEASRIEKQLNNGELSVEQAERLLENLYDPFLGNGKTRKIMEITQRQLKGEISERQATREIINEVPTGLPKPLDNFVKNFTLGAAGRLMENE